MTQVLTRAISHTLQEEAVRVAETRRFTAVVAGLQVREAGKAVTGLTATMMAVMALVAVVMAVTAQRVLLPLRTRRLQSLRRMRPDMVSATAVSSTWMRRIPADGRLSPGHAHGRVARQQGQQDAQQQHNSNRQRDRMARRRQNRLGWS